jgi:hypothetical protein
VNRAVVQMDEVTQQNAALVEQAAAAAASLEEQTRQLQMVVSGWKVAGGQTRSSVTAARPHAAARPNGSKSGSRNGKPHAQPAKAAPQAPAHSAAHPAAGKAASTAAGIAAHATPASATQGVDTTRVEPALKPKTARAASETAVRPAPAGAATAGSDADWETF